jgi:2-hydroxy-3-oxopropionate reductase
MVGEVLFGMGGAGAVHGMHEGSLFIDMASIQPREARDHAARLAERGLRHLDAPVSGGTVGADNGTLAIMAGGRAEDFRPPCPCSPLWAVPPMWARTAPASWPSWPTR